MMKANDTTPAPAHVDDLTEAHAHAIVEGEMAPRDVPEHGPLLGTWRVHVAFLIRETVEPTVGDSGATPFLRSRTRWTKFPAVGGRVVDLHGAGPVTGVRPSSGDVCAAVEYGTCSKPSLLGQGSGGRPGLGLRVEELARPERLEIVHAARDEDAAVRERDDRGMLARMSHPRRFAPRRRPDVVDQGAF